MPSCAFDSNVLLYAVSAERPKAEIATRLVNQGGLVSVQVLNETARVLSGRYSRPWSEVRTFLTSVRTVLAVRPVTIEIHELGLDLAERHKFSVFDAMIVAAALEAGCDTLWSEDMQHNMLVAGRLRIINPFLATA